MSSWCWARNSTSSVYGGSAAIAMAWGMSQRYGMCAWHRWMRSGASAEVASDERAALAEAADADPVGIDAVVGGRRLDAAHRVDVEAAVVVGAAVEDASRHHARRLRPGSGAGAGVAGVAGPPAAALRARVDDELAEPGGGVERVLHRVAAAAAVADEGDPARQPVAARRAHEPGAHRVAAGAGECDVVGLDVAEDLRAVTLEDGWARAHAGVGDRLLPVRVQVVRGGHRGAVAAQLFQWGVEVRHGSSLPRAVARVIADSAP